MKSITRHPLLFLWLVLAIGSLLFLRYSKEVAPKGFETFPSEYGGTLHFAEKSGDGTPVLVISGINDLEKVTEKWMVSSVTNPVFLIDGAAFLNDRKRAMDFKVASLFVDHFLGMRGVDSVHIVSYGPLSGIGAELGFSKTKTILSSTFLGASLLDEYSLLGDSRFNKAVLTSVKSIIWLIHVSVPHFGFLPTERWMSALSMMQKSETQDFKRKLGEWNFPVLLVHNPDNLIAPLSGAQETLRLLKNGKMITSKIPVSNQLAQSESDFSVSDILAFQQSVIDHTFSPDISKSSEPSPFRPVGIGLLIIFVSLVLATFVTEDITCFFAGILAASGMISFVFATAACITGLVVGDFGLYLLGRAGRKVLRKAPFKYFISESKLEKGADWVKQNGAKVIFISRFTPGMRTITYISAGLLKAPALSFLFYFILASLAWTPLLVGASMLAGYPLLPYFTSMEKNLLLVLISVWFGIWFIKNIIIPAFTWKGRRLLLSSLRRFYMWEFWPAWLFHMPTVFNWMYLSIRYRSTTAFTASNPGIPDSGFVGESKVQILSSIGDKSVVAKFEAIPFTLPLDEQFARFEAFMKRENFTYPIVLKPDVGQRGAGVSIVKNEAQARAFFTEAKEDSIAQEYIPGEEFGVFYVRYPWEEKGFITSITEKKFTSVTGDGVSTLEKLILSDNRAVCIARGMLKKHENQLNDIIPNGTVFKLTELGNHFRGAMFLDGKRLITPELTDRIDAISKTFPGFYFGRYDIRVPSAEDLALGRNIKVLELNGVTSEPTHIYHPGYSLFEGYKYLLGAWHHAFKIGNYNRKHGAKVTTVKQLLQYYGAFLAKPSV